MSAFKVFDEILNGDLIKYPTLFKNFTGFNNYFNYLVASDDNFDSGLVKLFTRDDIRKAIHVGKTEFGDDNVEKRLMNDFMQSVKPWVETLLDNYRVLFYNGQLDIIVAYPLTVNFLKNLNFKGADEYKTAKRFIWKVDSDVAGYIKKAGNMTEVLVRNAGHMVPTDQPKWALNLITNFTHNLI